MATEQPWDKYRKEEARQRFLKKESERLAKETQEAKMKKYAERWKPLDRSKPLFNMTDVLSSPKAEDIFKTPEDYKTPETKKNPKREAIKRIFTGKGKLRGFGGPGFLRGMNK